MTQWIHSFMGMELYKSMDSSASIGVLTFVDLDTDVVLAEVMKYGDRLEFRWGLDEKRCSHLHTYVVINADVVKTGEGSITTLTICDQSFHLRCNSAFSSYSNATKSSLVKQVVQTYQTFPPAIVSDSNDTAFTYVQAGENDWDFLLRNTVHSITADSAQYGDYRLFWKYGNELHFHPPDYSQFPYRKISISNNSSCMKYKMRVSMFKRSLQGGELSRVTGFLRDEVIPYTVDRTRFDMQGGGTVTLSNRDKMDMSYNSNRTGGFHGLYQFSERDRELFLDNVAKNQLCKAYSNTYELELYLEGDPMMEPGSLVQVTSWRDNYMDEGLWLVESVFHTIQKGQSHTTTVKMSRPFMTKGNRSMMVRTNEKRQEAVGPLSVVEGRNVSNVSGKAVIKTPQQL